MTETKTRTLADLQPGDEVVMRAGGAPSRILRIEYATKTQITVAGRRFYRATGSEVGASRGWSPYLDISPEAFRSARKHEAELGLRGFGLTREGIAAARAAADYAEQVINEEEGL